MQQSTFPGGIHPPDSKHTRERAIEEVRRPARLILPLSQHIGAPARALVAVGDEVVAGQRIAEPGGFVSAAIHTPLSGKVTAVGNFPHPMGQSAPAVVVEVAAEQPEKLLPVHTDDASGLDAKKKVEIVALAGIVGMGGATFPTQVKLSPPPGKTIDTVILNGVECEPYLTSDHRVMLEAADEIVAGLEQLRAILGAKTGIIGIEMNKPDAIAAMEKAIQGKSGLSVLGLTVKYPQGAEKQLIYAATRRQVPSGGLPMDVGCVVQNVGTAQAIQRAIVLGEPLVRRVVTLGGSLVKKPGNYMVPVGMLVSDLIEAAGGLTEHPHRVVMGGPMMGLALASMDVPVIKGSSGLLFLSKAEVRDVETRPCLSCGACVEACPMWLAPSLIARQVEHRRHDEALALGLLDCVECGSCAYVCPSGLPLVHAFKAGKKQAQAYLKAKK